MDTEKIYRIGKYEIYANRLCIVKDGRIVKVAPKVMDTLICLIERRGEVLSEEFLVEKRYLEKILPSIIFPFLVKK